MTAVRPSPQWSHLRWHWLQDIQDNSYHVQPWSAVTQMWIDHDVLVSPAKMNSAGWRYHGPCHPDAVLPDPTDVERIASRVVRDVRELGDRARPDDWREAMLVTGSELHAIVIAAMKGERG